MADLSDNPADVLRSIIEEIGFDAIGRMLGVPTGWIKGIDEKSFEEMRDYCAQMVPVYSITQKQSDIWAVITAYAIINRRFPLLTEVCDISGKAMGTVWKHMESLEKKGILKRVKTNSKFPWRLIAFHPETAKELGAEIPFWRI